MLHRKWLGPPVVLTVRVQAEGAAELKAGDVKFGLFPGGKRCCFTYTGPSSPKTIDVLSKLGFKTTIYCNPGTSAEHLYHRPEACARFFRLVMRAKCRGPAAASAIGGHYGTMHFPVARDPDDVAGYAFHDSNYLVLTDNKPYMVYLGRQRETVLMNRENFDNRIETGGVPNEMIYYQILANQFRGALQRDVKGQVVRFSLRDFKAPDLSDLADVIGDFGKHPRIWHASESMIAANEYIRLKTHVLEVKPAENGEILIRLGLERVVFPPFLLAPIPLQLPKSVKVKSAAVNGVSCPVTLTHEAACLDVPVQAVLSDGCGTSLATAAPDMAIPDEIPVTLSVRNHADKPLKINKLEWVGNIGFTVTGGEAPFDLAAGGEK